MALRVLCSHTLVLPLHRADLRGLLYQTCPETIFQTLVPFRFVFGHSLEIVNVQHAALHHGLGHILYLSGKNCVNFE